MKTANPTALLLSFFALLSAACSHRYYAPNTIHLPHFTDRHDLSLSGGYANGPEYEGLELSAAYSPAKHVGVMVNYFNVGSDNARKNDLAGDMHWGKGHLFEGAVGGYLPLDKNSTVSLFAGYGQGEAFNYFGDSRSADLSFRRFFFQPALTTQYRRLRLGFGLRLARLTYNKGLVNSDIDFENLSVIRALKEDEPFFLPEYSFQAGVRVAKGISLIGAMTYSPSKSAQKDNRFAGSNLLLGVLADVHRW